MGISVTLEADVYPDDENVTGIIIDLSEKGCKVALQIKPNWPVMIDEAEVKLNYSLDGKEVALSAKVKNHKLDNDVVYYGLAFTCEEKWIKKLLSRHTLLT